MSQLSVQFAYQWCAVAGHPTKRVYFSPTLRLLECRRKHILNELTYQATSALYTKIRQQLMQISQGGVLLDAQHSEAAPLCDFLKQLFFELNQAHVVLPPDLPGTEFTTWFPDFTLTETQKQALHTSVHKVVLPAYAPLWIESSIMRFGQFTFIATVLFGGLAVAVSLTHPFLAVFCGVLTAMGLMARASELNRWKRLGSYLQRVWAGTYYDKTPVFWAKTWKRALIGLGIVIPMGLLAAHQWTLQGILKGLFVLGEQLGLMPLLQHTAGQTLAFALFLIIVTGRLLRPLEYALKNTVGKNFLKGCLTYDCKRTEPAQEMTDYKAVVFGDVRLMIDGEKYKAVYQENEWKLQVPIQLLHVA